MAEKKDSSGLIEGEDFIILTPEINATTILPWDLRVINNTNHHIRLDFRHTNLMTKVLYISEDKEKKGESVQKEEIIKKRIGKEL